MKWYPTITSIWTVSFKNCEQILFNQLLYDKEARNYCKLLLLIILNSNK